MNQLYEYITDTGTIVNIIVIIFGLGMTRANLNSKLKELDKRVEKIEDLDLDSRLTKMQTDIDWIRVTLEKKHK